MEDPGSSGPMIQWLILGDPFPWPMRRSTEEVAASEGMELRGQALRSLSRHGLSRHGEAATGGSKAWALEHEELTLHEL